MNKKNIIIIVGIISFIVIILGISYSFFVYNKDVGSVSLNTGDISISSSSSSNSISYSNIIPLSDSQGKISPNYFDFTVNSTVDTEKIYYEVYLLPKSGNTLDTSYLKTYLTDQSNNEISEITVFDDLSDYETNGKIIYKGLVNINSNGTTKNDTKSLRLRLWLDESYSEQTSKIFDFDIYLHAINVEDVWAENIGYGDDPNCNTIQCQLEALAGN